VISTGGQTHFRADRAPKGAPAYCLDGCPAQRDCPYHVVRMYGGARWGGGWVRQMGAFKERHELWNALRNSRAGRCVYQCDNDGPDFQAVTIDFEGGIPAHLTVSGMGGGEARLARVVLDNGVIEMDTRTGLIRAETVNPPMRRDVESTEAGGDAVRAIMESFAEAVSARDRRLLPAPFGVSLDGHWMAFAAEESRLAGKPVDVRGADAGRGRN